MTIGDEPRADPDQTLAECLACGGQYQTLVETETGHRMTTCRWCFRGAMGEAQAKAWRAWSEEQRAKEAAKP